MYKFVVIVVVTMTLMCVASPTKFNAGFAESARRARAANPFFGSPISRKPKIPGSDNKFVPLNEAEKVNPLAESEDEDDSSVKSGSVDGNSGSANTGNNHGDGQLITGGSNNSYVNSRGHENNQKSDGVFSPNTNLNLGR